MATDEREDMALGCLLGALGGDAAGATLEFLRRTPTRGDVERAMQMPGGGVWNVAPGQITDDGELTLCLAQALSENGTFSLETIARSYARWIASNPFDIGRTTMQSLGAGSNSVGEKLGYGEAMRKAAKHLCWDSKANGSLMRASPLGIWGFRLEDEVLGSLAMQDSSLSHPNLSCCYGVGCYAIAIASLMRQPRDRATAYKQATLWLETRRTENPTAYLEVRGWLNDAEQNIKIPYSPHIGFIKIAFTHAFRHLLLGSDYVSAIRETLLGGGDTDTNACIVGGLIGAACGAEAIPESIKNPVLTCNTKQGGNPRPEFLQTTQVPALLKKLCNSHS